MFGFFKAIKESKIIEAAYKNALFVIMANYLKNVQPEQLARAATFYSLGPIPPDEGIRNYIYNNKNLIERTVRSVIEKDPDFCDLIAATALVAYGHLMAHGRVVEAEEVGKGFGFTLNARPEHLTPNGYKSLVDHWGRKMGFLK